MLAWQPIGVTSAEPPLVQRARESASKTLSADRNRLAHSAAAARVAAQAAGALARQEAEIIVAAAWLHDIGYAPTLRKTGYHPVDGALALMREAWPDRVVRLVAHHGLAALEAPFYSVAHHLGVIDPVPGLAAELLIYADMTSGTRGEPVSPLERAEHMRRNDRKGPVPEEVRESRYASLVSIAVGVSGRLGT